MPDPAGNDLHAQMPVAGIRLPQPLCLKGNLAENWKLFKWKWHNYNIIMYLHSQQLQYQTVLFFHTLGDDMLKVYNGFHFPTPNKYQKPEEILQVFHRYAVGETNVMYEYFMFPHKETRKV